MKKVANEPTFKELSGQIYTMIKDSDLAGYNSDRFDIPLLAERNYCVLKLILI